MVQNILKSSVVHEEGYRIRRCVFGMGDIM